MDDDATDYAEYARCLRDVGRANRASGGYRPTLRYLARALATVPHDAPPIRILDVGFGYGDVLRAVAAWCEKRGRAVELVGIDANAWSERAARDATPRGAPIVYATADAFSYEPERGFDFVLVSLVAHHLGDDEIVALLRRLERWAARGWFVNDLHRHIVPYAVAAIATNLARAHPFVRNDASLSVARAFVRRDWDRAIARAGLNGRARVAWDFPFRYCVSRTPDRA